MADGLFGLAPSSWPKYWKDEGNTSSALSSALPVDPDIQKALIIPQHTEGYYCDLMLGPNNTLYVIEEDYEDIYNAELDTYEDPYYLVIYDYINNLELLRYRFIVDSAWPTLTAVDAQGNAYICRDGIHVVSPSGVRTTSYFTEYYSSTYPTIAPDGTLYAKVQKIKNDGFTHLFAVDLETGVKKWEAVMPPGTMSNLARCPVLDSAGNIYVGMGGTQNNVVASFTPNGVLRWTLPASEPTALQTFVDMLNIFNDILYIYDSNNGTMYSVNLDGTLRWYVKNATFRISSRNFLSDGRVICLYRDIATNTYSIACLTDLSSSYQIDWLYPSGQIQTINTGAGDITYVVTKAPVKILAIAPNGGLLWERDLSSVFYYAYEAIIDTRDGMDHLMITTETYTPSTVLQIGGIPPSVPLVCDPPLMATSQSTSAKCPITFTCPTPTGEAPWLLHFAVRVYADEAGTVLVSELSTIYDFLLFQISTDNATWLPFPQEGIPPEQYGCQVRVMAELGPRTGVWIKLSVGAEDA